VYQFPGLGVKEEVRNMTVSESENVANDRAHSDTSGVAQPLGVPVQRVLVLFCKEMPQNWVEVLSYILEYFQLAHRIGEFVLLPDLCEAVVVLPIIRIISIKPLS
jgi:hypothetical protein